MPQPSVLVYPSQGIVEVLMGLVLAHFWIFGLRDLFSFAFLLCSCFGINAIYSGILTSVLTQQSYIKMTTSFQINIALSPVLNASDLILQG
jgi:hypothetical protein